MHAKENNLESQTIAESTSPGSEPASSAQVRRERRLAARMEPFDSFWQAPKDVEKGYRSFAEYYRQNYLPLMPRDKSASILVVSCGPGYLVKSLTDAGYTNVLGIDSDPEKIILAQAKQLKCETANAFPFLREHPAAYDVVIAEQELNHLTLDEQLEFLALCRLSLRPSGLVVVYGLNGANPLVGSENIAHNIDHFNLFTEYSLNQILELSGFRDIRILPLKIYVFWKNPLNYVGLAITGVLELFFRIVFKLYGKNVSVLSKKLAAIGRT